MITYIDEVVPISHVEDPHHCQEDWPVEYLWCGTHL